MRDRQYGGTDGLSDQDIMKGLIYVVTGEKIEAKGETFKKATSQYKTCEISGNTYIPFKDTATINAFSSEYINNTSDVLIRMSDFTGEYLNDKKKEWLTKAILETIQTDETIPDDTGFDLDYEIQQTKKGLTGTVFVNFDIFLADVLHFILTERSDNEKGKATFEKWFIRETPYSEWRFNSDIGGNTDCKIYFTHLQSSPIYKSLLEQQKPEDKRLNSSGKLINFVKAGDYPFKKYIEKTKRFYSKIKTLLYAENPQPFYDFYVCNTLEVEQRFVFPSDLTSESRVDKLENIDISKLESISNYVIISGTGGIGKSMMMRHLLLDSIDKYEELQKIPVLISLKNYDGSCNLKTLICNTIQSLDGSVTLYEVYDLLENGECIILLDGLDEIPSAARETFEKELELMTISLPDNTYVISSRPTSRFISYNRFTVMRINEFSKEQSLDLIDKLKFYDKEAKIKFRNDLENKLFKSHKQFASNPLLLTIMLMTHSSFGDIPAKMHVFYKKAFETMARLHDATKGAYKRPLHTNLEPEEFADLFAEFCARTYKAEILEFSLDTFVSYMNKVLENKPSKINIPANDFLKDLTDNLCIMYKEGEKYYFIHRSFQEYFTAVYFSTQMDDKLEIIGNFFERKEIHHSSDKTFDMMYDMIPEKMDRYIFLPYLTSLFKRCDEEKGLWTFLLELYPVINSTLDDAGKYFLNTPLSFLYEFISQKINHVERYELDDVSWPEDVDMFKTTWTVLENSYLNANTRETEVSRQYCDINNVPEAYIEKNGKPSISGWSWVIDVKTVVESGECEGTKLFMLTEFFPLAREYKAMREYTKELQIRMENQRKTTDWFDEL